MIVRRIRAAIQHQRAAGRITGDGTWDRVVGEGVGPGVNEEVIVRIHESVGLLQRAEERGPELQQPVAVAAVLASGSEILRHAIEAILDRRAIDTRRVHALHHDRRACHMRRRHRGAVEERVVPVRVCAGIVRRDSAEDARARGREIDGAAEIAATIQGIRVPRVADDERP